MLEADASDTHTYSTTSRDLLQENEATSTAHALSYKPRKMSRAKWLCYYCPETDLRKGCLKNSRGAHNIVEGLILILQILTTVTRLSPMPHMVGGDSSY